MKRTLFILLLASLLNASSITLAVAANASYATAALIKEFNKTYPDIEVKTILGSSGKLTAQISHNAPYDLFMSANMGYPQYLYEQKLAIAPPKVYAQGELVLLSKKTLHSRDIKTVLTDTKVSKIAVANPKTAPYGVATKEYLKNSALYELLKPKFIYGESISQTLSYAMSVTSIGFVAKSALFSPQLSTLKKGDNWLDLDSHLYQVIDQGIVILKHGASKRGSREFYDFIFSQKAQKIFQAFGYKTL